VAGASFAPWPSFTSEEADAIRRTLLSNRVNYWTGTECREFEKEFAGWVGTSHAVALANGSVALELALRTLGIGADDEVVVTPRSFVASATCVVNVGGRPIFADVDRESQNITAETIARVLTTRTRAIMCVHLAGTPCDMDPIMALASTHGLKVIEDCAQSHGAMYKGRMVGSIGHVGAWSFCQDKIMTTGGEGGMVTTNDRETWSKMWSYKDHGKSWDAIYARPHEGGFRWVHESFGTNWRMLEIQAVIGRIQLRHVAEWTSRRAANAARLAEVCGRFPILRLPKAPQGGIPAWYRFYGFVRTGHLRIGWSRDRIVEEIVARGVPCYQGSCAEIYLEKAFRDAALGPSDRLPNARALGDTSLCLLVHPTLTEDDMSRTCEALEEVLMRASR
jgi:dTDP-4-amino-4,6-dideoxygalactose transaminase